MKFIDIAMLIGWPIVHIVVGGALMILFKNWFIASRDRALPQSQAHRLVHPVSTLIVGVVASLFIAGIARAALRAGETFAAGGFSVFGLMGLLMVAEYICHRHDLFDEGIHYAGLLTCRRSLRWTEVTQVRYARGWKCFKLTTQAGEVVRIAGELMGLPQFAAAVLGQVAPQAIDEPTRSILEATAAGTPPELWK